VYLPACVATAVQKRICESSELKHRTLSKKTTGLSKTFATNFRRESVQRPSNSTVNNEQAVNRVKLRVYTSLQFLSVRFRLVLESPMSAHACVAETPTVGGSSVRSAQATARPWRGPPAPTAQARAGSVPLSLTPRAVALSATAQLPRMLALLCRADGSRGGARGHEATRRLAAGRMGVSVVLPRSREVEGGGAAALAGRPGISWRWQEDGGSGGCVSSRNR